MMNFKVFLTTVAHSTKMKRISLKTHVGMNNYGKKSNAMGMCSASRYITLYCQLQTSFESMTYVSVYSGAFPGNAV